MEKYVVEGVGLHLLRKLWAQVRSYSHSGLVGFTSVVVSSKATFRVRPVSMSR